MHIDGNDSDDFGSLVQSELQLDSLNQILQSDFAYFKVFFHSVFLSFFKLFEYLGSLFGPRNLCYHERDLGALVVDPDVSWLVRVAVPVIARRFGFG